MARINENLLVKGARGNVGKQFVYRKHGNSTIIGKMPVYDPKTARSDAQLTVRDQFTSAAMYARGAVQSPELKKEYQKKAAPGMSAYNMALRDYLKAPVVRKINIDAFDGPPGSTIVVHAKDDFRVTAVRVRIQRVETGEILEEGNAILAPVHRDQWIYTTTQAYPSLDGLIVTATATDLPGNEASLAVTT
ncbi:hypothetical protein WJU16_22865 [Chitinophaga pollutisoli]|uniref:Uncharacterized protein n=1 Tax=Chitinophaga pollutisoli TaxID=3133966 RepID=A0ABZ2YNB9_9BACT